MPLPPPKTPRIGLIYIHSLHRGLSPVSRAAFSTSNCQKSEPDISFLKRQTFSRYGQAKLFTYLEALSF